MTEFCKRFELMTSKTRNMNDNVDIKVAAAGAAGDADAAAAADRQQTPPLAARGSPKTDESPRTRRRVEWSPRRQGLDASSVERSRCNVESEAASSALRSPTGSLRSAHNDYLRE